MRPVLPVRIRQELLAEFDSLHEGASEARCRAGKMQGHTNFCAPVQLARACAWGHVQQVISAHSCNSKSQSQVGRQPTDAANGYRGSALLLGSQVLPRSAVTSPSLHFNLQARVMTCAMRKKFFQRGSSVNKDGLEVAQQCFVSNQLRFWQEHVADKDDYMAAMCPTEFRPKEGHLVAGAQSWVQSCRRRGYDAVNSPNHQQGTFVLRQHGLYAVAKVTLPLTRSWASFFAPGPCIVAASMLEREVPQRSSRRAVLQGMQVRRVEDKLSKKDGI